MENSSMYKEHILELWKHPENHHELKGATHEKRGYNPSCGDDITLYLKVVGDKVHEASFTGTGCALCVACSSLFTEKLKGMKISDVLKMNSKDLLKLLEIDIHPARLKCILLPLETAKSMIEKK